MTLTTSTASPATSPSTASRSTGDGYTVEVEHVTKRYGDNTVVDDLSFTVPPGRVTGFLGPNGSGKSTTMKIMLDLADASRGTTTIGGHRYRDLPDPARTVGAMIESDAFHPGRSGRNHLRILADATGIAHSSARISRYRSASPTPRTAKPARIRSVCANASASPPR